MFKSCTYEQLCALCLVVGQCIHGGGCACAAEMPIQVNPLQTERCAYVCDRGRPRAALERHYKNDNVDFSGMPRDAVWW